MSRTRPRRRDVVARILSVRGDALLVTGLGATSWDAAAAGDHPGNFYLWGGMGGAAMTGLGLALARPERRVLVLTGDGEALMGLGALATIANQRPSNLALVVIDNERYGETGGQRTHTAGATDLAAVGRAVGIEAACMVQTGVELEAALPLILATDGPVMVVVKVQADTPPLVLPPRDGAALKERFRAALALPVGAGRRRRNE